MVSCCCIQYSCPSFQVSTEGKTKKKGGITFPSQSSASYLFTLLHTHTKSPSDFHSSFITLSPAFYL